MKDTDFTIVRTNAVGGGDSDCFMTLCVPAEKKMEMKEESPDIEIVKVVAGEVLYMGDTECHMYDVPEKDISIVELD